MNTKVEVTGGVFARKILFRYCLCWVREVFLLWRSQSPKKHTYIKKPTLKQEKRTKLSHQPWHQGIFITKNLFKESLTRKSFTKMSLIMKKRKANSFATIHSKVEVFKKLSKTPGFGTIDGNIFYRTFAFVNNEFALMVLAETVTKFLNRLQSINNDAVAVYPRSLRTLRKKRTSPDCLKFRRIFIKSLDFPFPFI